MRKLKITPSERHSQDIVALDGSKIPAGVPHLDKAFASGSRRIAFGEVVEVDDLPHWRGALKKGDVVPADEATAKLVGIPLAKKGNSK